MNWPRKGKKFLMCGSKYEIKSCISYIHCFHSCPNLFLLDRLNSERMRIMKLVDAQIAKMGPQMQVILCFSANLDKMYIHSLENTQKP